MGFSIYLNMSVSDTGFLLLNTPLKIMSYVALKMILVIATFFYLVHPYK